METTQLWSVTAVYGNGDCRVIEVEAIWSREACVKAARVLEDDRDQSWTIESVEVVKGVVA